MEQSENNKVILGFGSFDGLHDGHRFFIDEIKKRGERVVIAVAPDEVIEKIKGRSPRFALSERIGALKSQFPDIEFIPADSEIGNWKILEKVKPDVVAIGYDQMSLKESLEKSGTEPLPEIVVINSHEPEKFKSSLII